MRGYIFLAIALMFGLSSCATVQSVPIKHNQNMLRSYRNQNTAIKTDTIKIDVLKGLRQEDNSVPVILPPVVRPVWIVDHVNSDGVFIRGHWVFVKIRGFEWYIQAIENDEDINKILEEGR